MSPQSMPCLVVVGCSRKIDDFSQANSISLLVFQLQGFMSLKKTLINVTKTRGKGKSYTNELDSQCTAP